MPSTRPFESRYATLQVPESWVAEAPFSAVEAGTRWDRISVELLEWWNDQAFSAEEWLERQKAGLEAIHDEEVEFLGEGRLESGGPGEGCWIATRFRDEDQELALETKLWLLHGPLVCQLTIAGFDTGPDRDRDRLFGEIGKSFRLKGVEFLGKSERLGFFPAEPAVAPVDRGQPRREFPFCCVSVPELPGWDLRRDESIRFVRESTEIRAERWLATDGEPGPWLSARMGELQSGGEALVFGWDQGEFEDRGEWAAISYQARGLRQSWKTAAVRQTTELLVRDQQALRWVLDGPVESMAGLAPLVQSLVLSAELLPPEKWRTRVVEPWCDLVLEGHWLPQGGGAYFQLEERTVLSLVSAKSTVPLASLRGQLVEAVRKVPKGTKVSGESDAATAGRGLDVVRYAREEEGPDGEKKSIRLAWFSDGKELRTAFVQAFSPETAAVLLARVAEGAR